jgi:uncharacterized repeat protein (TIGR03803 family)
MTGRTLFHSRFLLCFLAIAISATEARAQTYTDLFDFDGTSHGCCSTFPGVLAQGRDGNLYGTALQGGANGRGVIFKSTLTGTVTVVHNFNVTDGFNPQGGLSLGTDGNFYGTTASGGSHSAGTIFQITPSGTHTVLYNFANGTDGGFPRNSPVQGSDGQLYGTTVVGSNSTIYKVTTAGTFTKIATLGLECDGPLTLATDGKFYGVTLVGGTSNRGSVFSATNAGVMKTIFSFNDPTGALPFGPILQGTDGNFYGTASVGGTMGGGVVYKLTTAGVFTVLHNFDSTTRKLGFDPVTGVVQGSDGFLYGVTSGGGAHLDGTIFKVKTDGTGFAVVHDFDGSHGSVPNSQPLLHTNGNMYGQTNSGGAHNDGVIYSLAAGLKPFVQPVVINQAKVGGSVGLLGQNFSTATQVLFGAGVGTFTSSGNGFMTAKPTNGATTGVITVDEPGGNLVSLRTFKILPVIKTFAPTSGPVRTQVLLTGTSFTQATTVKFGTKVATFTVNSDTQITTTVPTGAVTGKISVASPGGTASTATNFTVQ